MLVGIVAQHGNERAVAVAGTLLERLDCSRYVDTATADALGVDGTPVSEFDDCDLVVTIGGDGTFLFAARNAGTVPIMGVNLGEVGFMNAVAPEDAVTVTEREVERFRETGAVRSEPIPRLSAGVPDADLPPALNEVSVLGPQRGHGHGVSLTVRVDGETYADTHADGVLVATPTGSTAYNMSESGPLLQPGTDALVLNLMAAADPMPPLVVPADVVVEVDLADADHAFAASDGASPARLAPPTTVSVSLAEDPALVAGPGVDFFEALGKLE